MKKIAIYISMCLFAMTSFACNTEKNENTEKQAEVKAEVIEVYYFHFSRRCITCNAVEDVTKEALNQYFADEMKSGKIVFKSVNLNEAENKQLAESLKISGQALLFVKGNKQINLTNEGFMYAKSKPEKLEAKVKETVEQM